MERHEYDTLFAAEDQHWWFVGTRRVILRLVDMALDQLRLSPGSGGGGANPTVTPDVLPKVLDVGCGTGGTLATLGARNLDRFGIEPEQAAVAFCHRRGLTQVRQGYAEHLPFPSDSFDIVLALDVLEHLDDDRAGLAEIVRVTRPGGYVLLTVPAHPLLWSEHDIALHHRRRYTRKTFTALLETQPISQQVFSYYNSVLLPVVAAVRLAGRLRSRQVTPANAKSDVQLPWWPINRLLCAMLAAEQYVLPHVALPMGVSLVTLCQKS